MLHARPCELPRASRLKGSLARIDYVDSFAVPLMSADKELVVIYAAVLGDLPKVFKQFLVLRSILVRPFGIAGVSYSELNQRIDIERAYKVGDKIGRWTLFEQYPDELVTGANDGHLDFRVSLFREADKRIVLSTAVMTHNVWGRMYLTTILPFHRFAVAKLLTSAAASGRI